MVQQGEVHLWCASIQVDPAVQQQLLQTLTPDERQRAERFYRQEHQQRFVASRGILRAILARYLNTSPEQIQFDYGSHGKPFVKSPANLPKLEFNLSHSQDRALYAIALHHRIGIDLEAIRPVADLEQLTRRFFALAEHQTIQSLPDDARQQAFFQFWTLKESVLKGLGDGLTKLEEVEVAIAPNFVQLVRLGETSPSAWSLWQFIPAPNYMAALAVEGKEQRLVFWQWEEKAESRRF
jgi:4'-phosphopantetheinyl transferase